MMIDGYFSIDIGEAIAMVPDFDPIQNTEASALSWPESEADDWQALVVQYNITDFDENACSKLSNLRILGRKTSVFGHGSFLYIDK